MAELVEELPKSLLPRTSENLGLNTKPLFLSQLAYFLSYISFSNSQYFRFLFMLSIFLISD